MRRGFAHAGRVKRPLSAAALGALAIGATWWGGWPFAFLWTAAAIGVSWEWIAIVGAARRAQVAGALVLAASGALAAAGSPVASVLLIAAGALAVAALDREKAYWCAAGMLYAGCVLAGPAVLRRDPEFGALALWYLFAVVWSTDTLALFGGRLIGGPKLARAISPNKTWSGALSGALAGVCAGWVVAAVGGLANPLAAAGLALLLSIVAQGGDLFESAVKRRFGVKDSGWIIPGHGGLMDRLDGFLAAAGAAVLIGLARGGVDGAAAGLLAWRP